jgi:hypothetical protein
MFPIYYDVNGRLLKKEVIKIGRFGFTADAVSSLKYEPRISYETGASGMGYNTGSSKRPNF